MNEIRNAANAHHLLYKEIYTTYFTTDSPYEFKEKFKFDWELYMGNEPSDDVSEKFHM